MFPPAAELTFLIGKELGQIAIHPHSVQLRWSDGGQITVEGGLEHVDETGSSTSYDCTAHTGPPLLLHRLLNRKVQMLDAEPGLLTLVFDGGQKLRLKAEDGRGECGLIQFNDDLADDWIVY